MEENNRGELRKDAPVEERNATLDENPAPAMTADELQESILEDSGLNAFQKFCARMDDVKWARMQRIVGALLGVIAGVALFWDTLVPPAAGAAQQQGLFSIPLIIAIVVALIVPNIIERQSLRRVPKLRVAMVIALALVLVAYFVAVGVQTGFRFTE